MSSASTYSLPTTTPRRESGNWNPHSDQDVSPVETKHSARCIGALNPIQNRHPAATIANRKRWTRIAREASMRRMNAVASSLSPHLYWVSQTADDCLKSEHGSRPAISWSTRARPPQGSLRGPGELGQECPPGSGITGHTNEATMSSALTKPPAIAAWTSAAESRSPLPLASTAATAAS